MIWYESRVALPKEFINTSTVNKEMTALLTCVEKWSTWWGQKCCSCMLVCNPPRSFKCVAVKLLSQGETVKTCQQPLFSVTENCSLFTQLTVICSGQEMIIAPLFEDTVKPDRTFIRPCLLFPKFLLQRFFLFTHNNKAAKLWHKIKFRFPLLSCRVG